MSRDERWREEPTSEPDDRTIVDHGVGEPDHLQRLWTPHRMTYIAEAPMKGGSAASERPFTDIPTLSDEDGLVVARGELVYVVLNLYPYNPGHSMVVPYRRVSELEDLTAEESAELMAFTQKVIRVIKSVSRPHGFNVGLNLGNVRRRIAGRASAHARGPAVERRRELHHDHRRLQDRPAAVA